MTEEYAEAPAGAGFVDVDAICTKVGIEGNNFLKGQINVLVDPLPYVESVENITGPCRSDLCSRSAQDHRSSRRGPKPLQSRSWAGRRILALVERTRLMAAVDSLEERILDYLAVELRTPAYEDSLPLETKRTLIKGTLPYYASLGTPAAVDWVIKAVFGNGGIDEWFNYGGEPHHFQVNIPIAGMITPKMMEELRRMIASAPQGPKCGVSPAGRRRRWLLFLGCAGGCCSKGR